MEKKGRHIRICVLFLFAFVAVSVLVIASVTVSSDDPQGTNENGDRFVCGELLYEINADGTSVTVLRLAYDKWPKDLVIPTTVTFREKDYKVTAIVENAFNSRYFGGKLTLGDNLQTIGDGAFKNCHFTGDLTIPSSVKSFGATAFIGCDFNGTLTIGDSLQSIGNSAFRNCKFTGDLTIPSSVESIGESAFENCSFNGTLMLGNSLQSVGNSAFRNCKFTGHLTIPSSVKSIGESAFRDCSFNGMLTLNNGLQSIGYCAFYNCKFMGNLEIPPSVEYIGSLGFCNCCFAGKLTLHDGLQSIGGYAFSECKFTGDLTIPSTVKSIASAAFEYCCFDGKLTLNEGLQIIADGVFRDCKFKGNLTIPSTVTEIQPRAFSGCKFTGNLTIPSSVESIGISAFYDCGFTEVNILAGKLSKIARYSFGECKQLKSVNIPNSIIEISENAFNGCIQLDRIAIWYSGYMLIDENAFPNHVFYDGSKKLGMRELPGNIFVAHGKEGDKIKMISELFIENGLCYDIAGTDAMIIGYEENFGTTDLTIPSTVKHGSTYNVIGVVDNAFKDCTILQKLTLPNTVKWVGSDAFRGCANLKEIKFGCKVGTVDSNAFPSHVFKNFDDIQITPGDIFRGMIFKGDSISNMQSVGMEGECGDTIQFKFTASNGKLEIFGTGPMSDYTSASIPWKNAISFIKEVSIGYGVTSIGNSAFQYCTGLTSLTIPANVTSIGNSAFKGCTGLTSIVVPDNVQLVNANAFSDCTNLKEIKIGCKVGTIDPNAFPSHVFKDFDGQIIPSDKFKGRTFKGDTINEMLSISIEGDCGYEGNNVQFKFTASDGKLTISGSGKMKDYSSNPVPWGSAVMFIKEVSVGNGVTSIGDSAFKGCKLLATVTVPDSVTSIGNDAFNTCVSLEYAIISSNVKSIGVRAFNACELLTMIAFGEGVIGINPNAFPSHVFYDGETKITDMSKLAGNVFCDSGERIGNKIKMVNAEVFTDNGIKYISDGRDAVIVGVDSSFSDSEFTVPGTVVYKGVRCNVIGIIENSFKNCTVLQKLKVPNTVQFISGNAFGGCTNLKEITVENGVTGISSDAFPDRVFYEHDIKLGMQELPGKTFVADGNKEGKIKMAMILPGFVVDGVRYCYSGGNDVVIYSYTVDFQTAVFEVPSKVSYDGNDYTVTKIGERAFADCTVLQKLIVSDNMQSIDSNAFKGCENLKEIEIGSKVGTMAANAFPSHVFKDFDGSQIIPGDDFKGRTFKGDTISEMLSISIEGSCGFDGDNVIFKFTATDGKLIMTGTGKMKDYSNNPVPWKSAVMFIKEVSVGNGVTSIGDSAFKGCRLLATVTVPDSVTSIGNDAFNTCVSLEFAIISDNVKSIGARAFNACELLTMIAFGEGVSGINPNAFPSHVFYDGETKITDMSKLAGNVFWDSGKRIDKKIKMVNAEAFTDNGIKYISDGYDAVIVGVDSSFSDSEFTVPGTVVYKGVTCNVIGIIGNSFKNCTVLQKLKVPDTVQFINGNAFGGCTNLKKITIAGSVNSNAISIDDNAFPSHAFFTKSGASIAASKLPGYTYYAGGTTADGKIKMIRDEPSPTPQPEPVPTPDKPINDPTMTFMAVIIGTVIALAGLAILIARRK